MYPMSVLTVVACIYLISCASTSKFVSNETQVEHVKENYNNKTEELVVKKRAEFEEQQKSLAEESFLNTIKQACQNGKKSACEDLLKAADDEDEKILYLNKLCLLKVKESCTELKKLTLKKQCDDETGPKNSCYLYVFATFSVEEIINSSDLLDYVKKSCDKDDKVSCNAFNRIKKIVEKKEADAKFNDYLKDRIYLGATKAVILEKFGTPDSVRSDYTYCKTDKDSGECIKKLTYTAFRYKGKNLCEGEIYEKVGCELFFNEDGLLVDQVGFNPKHIALEYWK